MIQSDSAREKADFYGMTSKKDGMIRNAFASDCKHECSGHNR
jgi:hypothetical protein